MSVYPPDYESDVGKIRALIPDVERVDQDDTGEVNYLFEDEHLLAILAVQRQVEGAPMARLRRAAADAVDALATSEAYISKVIKTEDLQTDGAKVANAMTTRAANLRRDADREEDEVFATAFEVVPFQPRPLETLPLSWRGWPGGGLC
jgi:hypothetical protein